MKRSLKTLSILMFIAYSLNINAQRDEFDVTKSIMNWIPDSLTTTTNGIAKYIDANFRTDKQKTKAIFFWITNNINYDSANKYRINDSDQNVDISYRTLRTRKGVCTDYTHLFSEISKKVGIKTYTISGYAKIDNNINYNMHTWCVSNIDSEWYFTDPTWGAGYTEKGVFIRDMQIKYFMVEPKLFIKSHMPLDPLWQFLNHPVTKNEFSKKRIKVNTNSKFFNYTDSLKRYDNLSEIERLYSEYLRTLNNGITNYIDYDNICRLKNGINKYHQEQNRKIYNRAQRFYDKGISAYNSYIDYKNRYYTPYKSDSEITEMLNIAKRAFDNTSATLDSIYKVSGNINDNKLRLESIIETLNRDLKEEYNNLDNYLRVAKDYRKKLKELQQED